MRQRRGATATTPTARSSTPRGFWGTMNTEGAANVNGDAYQPYYDTRREHRRAGLSGRHARACYDTTNYYNYAIEMPPGSTGRLRLHLRPGVLRDEPARGTGDRWFSGTHRRQLLLRALRHEQHAVQPGDDASPPASTLRQRVTKMSLQHERLDRRGTAAPSAMRKDTAYGDARDYHDAWYLLNPANPLTGGADGTLYRLHTTGTDPEQRRRPAQHRRRAELRASTSRPRHGGYATDLRPGCDADVLALSSARGGDLLRVLPRPGPGRACGQDPRDQPLGPGRHGTLNANIQIEIPTAVGWTPTTMTWSCGEGHDQRGGRNCASTQPRAATPSSPMPAVAAGVFNGCWLTIDVTIPDDYTAPQGGWWKIKYNMTGSGTSIDVTTWTATSAVTRSTSSCRSGGNLTDRHSGRPSATGGHCICGRVAGSPGRGSGGGSTHPPESSIRAGPIPTRSGAWATTVPHGSTIIDRPNAG